MIQRTVYTIYYICISWYFFNMFCNIDFGYLVGQNLLNYQRAFFLLSSWEYKSSILIPFWKFFHPTRPIIKFHQYGINFQRDEIKFHENVLPTRLFGTTLLFFSLWPLFYYYKYISEVRFPKGLAIAKQYMYLLKNVNKTKIFIIMLHLYCYLLPTYIFIEI